MQDPDCSGRAPGGGRRGSPGAGGGSRRGAGGRWGAGKSSRAAATARQQNGRAPKELLVQGDPGRLGLITPQVLVWRRHLLGDGSKRRWIGTLVAARSHGEGRVHDHGTRSQFHSNSSSLCFWAATPVRPEPDRELGSCR